MIKMGEIKLKINIFFVLIFSVCITVVNAGEEKVKIVVGSAPSVKSVVEKAAELYMKKNPEVEIKFSFAASGTIQSQIENGAEIDIFIGVGGKNMGELEKNGLIEKNSRVKIAQDELVCVTDKQNKDINKLEDLLKSDIKIIADGEPSIVPCAKTTEETLKYIGIYEKIKPKFIFCKDLMQVMSYVESGNSDAGFVWKSIAVKSQKVKIVFEGNEKMHQPVFIEAGAVSSGKNIEKSREFIKFLTDKEIERVFKESGFN